MDQIRVRDAVRADAAFMAAMLVEAVNAVTPLPPDQLSHDPQIRGYLANWPRRTDHGFVAIDERGRSVGACWLRYRSAADPGYGHLADDIPELTIAVRPDRRGRGVGRTLLSRTVTDARARGIKHLSLNVERGNHAAGSLYRSLGWLTVSSDADSETMRLDLTADSDQ